MNSAEDASEIWKKNIDSIAKHFFAFDNNNWIISGKMNLLGNWLEIFNNRNYDKIANILSEQVDWKDNDEIVFCVSDTISFTCSWVVFKANWSDFLCINDECPIVINDNDVKNILLFEVSGRLLKVNKG
jgi:hypothetical protein